MPRVVRPAAAAAGGGTTLHAALLGRQSCQAAAAACRPPALGWRFPCPARQCRAPAASRLSPSPLLPRISTNSTTETYQLKARACLPLSSWCCLLGGCRLMLALPPLPPPCCLFCSRLHRQCNLHSMRLFLLPPRPQCNLHSMRLFLLPPRPQCNLNLKFTQNNTIDCELDQGPLHRAIKFSCDAGVSGNLEAWRGLSC